MTMPLEYKWNSILRNGAETTLRLTLWETVESAGVDAEGKPILVYDRSKPERAVLSFDGDLDDATLNAVCRKWVDEAYPLEVKWVSQTKQAGDANADDPKAVG